MLRNWLILVSDEWQSKQISDHSSYNAVESLKDVKVALLSGQYTGVTVLSILEEDKKSFAGFISSLKGHPALQKVQVIILDQMKHNFSSEQQVGLKFFSFEQISKLIDVPLSTEETPKSTNIISSVQRIETNIETAVDLDDVDYLKHICAKAIANMIVEGAVNGDRNSVLEVLSKKVRQG